MVQLDAGGSTYCSSLCNHSEPVLAKLGFPFLTSNRRKLSRIEFLWCLSESRSLFPAVRPCLVSFECLHFTFSAWDHPDIKSSPLNLPNLGWTYTSLIFSWNLDITPFFNFFFNGIQLTGCFILLPLWDTHRHVVPFSAGMFIHLAAPF